MQAPAIRSLAQDVIQKARAKSVMLATAESCTGGMIAAALTDIAGASAVLDRGFVAYSNDAKHEMLGVPINLIAQHGAVSGEVARAMAEGALAHSRADISVSVTGIAGPGGGTEEKPVGLVWFGLAARGRKARAERRLFAPGSRDVVRAKATETALAFLLATMES